MQWDDPESTPRKTARHALSRRKLFQGATALAGAAAVDSIVPGVAAGSPNDYPATHESKTDRVLASMAEAIAETTCGKVRGYIRMGIFTYKGIPYAADTSEANRFLPPQPVQPWKGVRSSMQFGFVCPQPHRTGKAGDEEAWMNQWDEGIQGEDCLRLNVWTPGLGSTKKRPVMVWLHSGGYYQGSSQEFPSYDGENLSRRGDLVVVSLNHRLNVFGHLDLSAYGERYRASANAGMLDLVAALEWVRDNIANFGGDPNLVTVFGQSGGGGKVTTLMAMPSASGLFHRGIVQSGSMLRALTREDSAALAAGLLRKLELSPSRVDELQQIPAAKLSAAAAAVEPPWPNLRSGFRDTRRRGSSHPWAPAVDGFVLPEQPFIPKAPEISKHIPMIIGTTLNEFVTAINHPEYMRMDEAQLLANVEEMYPGKAARVVEIFRRDFPNAHPFDLWSVISVAPMRFDALQQANTKAAQGGAPAYCYWFWWQPPVLEGRPMAFHTSEIAFVFDNTDRSENMTGGGAAARALAAKMTDAWIQFARTGNPNHPGLPQWEPVTAGTNATMVFDNECFFRDNLDDEQQRIISQS